MISQIFRIDLFLSFNRYMVECELYTHSEPHIEEIVLIDTWWNVNILQRER